MKTKVINTVKSKMKILLDETQIVELENVLYDALDNFDVIKTDNYLTINDSKKNQDLLDYYISAKRVEGCSERTITYYKTTITKMLDNVNLKIESISTDDLRKYLADYKNNHIVSKITLDNIRRFLSSFFSWLEDEDYILKNPVRRIKKIKTKKLLKMLFLMRILKFYEIPALM